MPNAIIVLGHDPEEFSGKEIAGRIYLNKYDLDVWFNRWINF